MSTLALAGLGSGTYTGGVGGSLVLPTVTIGPAIANRIVVVAVTYQTGGPVGGSATLLPTINGTVVPAGQYKVAGDSGFNSSVEMCWAFAPTLTVVDAVFRTMAASPADYAYAIYVLNGLLATTAFDFKATASGNPAPTPGTVALDIPANGIAVAVANVRDTGHVWTGLAQDLNVAFGSLALATHSHHTTATAVGMSAQTGRTITVDNTGSPSFEQMIAVSFTGDVVSSSATGALAAGAATVVGSSGSSAVIATSASLAAGAATLVGRDVIAPPVSTGGGGGGGGGLARHYGNLSRSARRDQALRRARDERIDRSVEEAYDRLHGLLKEAPPEVQAELGPSAKALIAPAVLGKARAAQSMPPPSKIDFALLADVQGIEARLEALAAAVMRARNQAQAARVNAQFQAHAARVQAQLEAQAQIDDDEEDDLLLTA